MDSREYILKNIYKDDGKKMKMERVQEIIYEQFKSPIVIHSSALSLCRVKYKLLLANKIDSLNSLSEEDFSSTTTIFLT
jgi:hypothetical protein